MARFAVAGSGIAGLSAAWELEQAGHDVVVFEALRHAGGKLQQSAVPGVDFPVETGADAFLARVPDALELCDALGIDDLVHPATGDAWVYAGDGLRPLPKGQLLGLPTDLAELAASGLVSPEGIERARQDLTSKAAPVTADVSVGELVRSRLGDEICDHLVEPLLGGINGGEADGLSTEACAPQIWACARQGGSLITAAAAMKAAGDPTVPVFAAPAAGMAALPARLRDVLRAELRLGTPAPTPVVSDDGVRLGDEAFAGFVLAVPADTAGGLLASVAPDASDILTTADFAGVVMVTAVADRASVDHPMAGSGIVVARTCDDVSITAASWGSSKWAHWDDGRHALFRISLGHAGDATDWCARSDEELARVALDDLARIMGVPIEPVGVRVGRWPNSFPQYRPGHIGRVAEARAEVAAAGPIALAGMSFDGIGVPACIRSGRTAARSLLA